MSARRLFGLGSLVLTGAAFITRTRQSLGYDELFTVWVSARPFADLIHQANLDGFTPPAFYALVRLLSILGLSNESLRVLPVLFAGLAVYLGLQACERLFGSSSRWPAVLVIAGSAYVFTFAQELRPYSALLACAFFFLGQLGGPVSDKSDLRAGVAALLATLLSYLGLALVALWVFECFRRRPKAHTAFVSLAAMLLCAPGLLKAFALAAARGDSSIAWSKTWPALSPVLFGLAPFPYDGRAESASLVLLAALLALALSARDLPSLGFLARAFGVFTLSLFALDLVVPIGFAPRYFALPMGALMMLIVGTVTRLGRPGLLVALVFLGINGSAVFRYLTTLPPAREDWRGAMARIETRLGSHGVLLAFPFHHAAVAAYAYAPGLVLGGGYTSRSGPLFWYEPPASFSGYSFDGLKKMDDPGQVFRRLAPDSNLCVLSDEPDATKTAALFGAFTALGGVESFDTGDSRLRALCRQKG